MNMTMIDNKMNNSFEEGESAYGTTSNTTQKTMLRGRP
jgi:hypothetical protein